MLPASMRTITHRPFIATIATIACFAACAGASPAARNSSMAAAPPLGHPSADSLRNANGSPRITDGNAYETMLQRIAPVLDSVRRDARLQLDPDLIAALLFKESGGDSLAVSAAPALGLAQLTRIADAEMRRITSPVKPAWPAYGWMGVEIERWPRDPLVHAADATLRPDTLIARGLLTARTEYLLDPALSARASALWLRLLIARWSDDSLPGGYAQDARVSLASLGTAISQAQLLALAIVSYNRGAAWVRERILRDGASWTSHLADGTPEGIEAADYLERVQAYARTFRNSPPHVQRR